MLAEELAVLFARDLTRLRQELEAFPDDASLWATAPGVVNCAGSLALHLEGNMREYIGRQLGGMDYRRDRPSEFSTRGLPRAELVSRAGRVEREIPPVIASLADPILARAYPEVVLGVALTTRQFLVHLNGHLNYHLGQIDYLRRVITGSGSVALAGLS